MQQHEWMLKVMKNLPNSPYISHQLVNIVVQLIDQHLGRSPFQSNSLLL